MVVSGHRDRKATRTLRTPRSDGGMSGGETTRSTLDSDRIERKGDDLTSNQHPKQQREQKLHHDDIPAGVDHDQKRHQHDIDDNTDTDGKTTSEQATHSLMSEDDEVIPQYTFTSSLYPKLCWLLDGQDLVMGLNTKPQQSIGSQRRDSKVPSLLPSSIPAKTSLTAGSRASAPIAPSSRPPPSSLSPSRDRRHAANYAANQSSLSPPSTSRQRRDGWWPRSPQKVASETIGESDTARALKWSHRLTRLHSNDIPLEAKTIPLLPSHIMLQAASSATRRQYGVASDDEVDLSDDTSHQRHRSYQPQQQPPHQQQQRRNDSDYSDDDENENDGYNHYNNGIPDNDDDLIERSRRQRMIPIPTLTTPPIRSSKSTPESLSSHHQRPSVASIPPTLPSSSHDRGGGRAHRRQGSTLTPSSTIAPVAIVYDGTTPICRCGRCGRPRRLTQRDVHSLLRT
jgi:hypothetical protein